jgi:hypothetical protein
MLGVDKLDEISIPAALLKTRDYYLGLHKTSSLVSSSALRGVKMIA